MLQLIPQKMIRNYEEEVYQKISEITGFKFKSQIKDSGIVFKKIFEMRNLLSNDIHYLIFTESNSIKFKDREDFIQEFIIHIKKSIEQLNADYESVLEMQNQAVVDDNYIYMENERIGFCGEKQLKLLNKMREFRTNISNVNK